MNAQLWSQVCRYVQSQVGENNFVTWIQPLSLIEIGEATARLGAPTGFIATWTSRNFAESLRHGFRAAGHPVERIDITVVAPTARVAPRAALLPRRSPLRPDDPEAGSALDPRLTFDTFVVGKPNALAHAAARRVAEGASVSFNPLFLHGTVGLGKTHLMHAIAHELSARAPEKKVLYLSAERFMYRFVQALRDRQVMDFKSLFRSVDVLLVDDIQFIAGKDSTQEEFFHTFNALVDQGRQIVLSADRPPGDIRDLEDRITSRLQSGLVVDLHPTDYELRLGILQQRLEQHIATDGPVEIGPEVLEFLARRITTDVRDLTGALNRLFAQASLVQRAITLEHAQDSLVDLLRRSDRRIGIEDIQRKVAEHYNVRLADLVGPRRLRTVARPRQVAMYLAKVLTTRSLPEIGRRFGGRDHTTILHGVRKVEELIRSDQQLAEDVELLRRQLMF